MADTASLTTRDIRTALADNQLLRARELADELGISEAELVAAHVGYGNVKISANPDDVMSAASALGDVMALTRTPSVVHEKVGTYEEYHTGEHAAMVLGDAIDLRIFPRHWKHAFAVEVPAEHGPRRSLQIFDAAGDAVHKIHLRDGSRHEDWAAIVAGLALADQTDSLQVEARVMATPAEERHDRADDLRAEWDRMTDTHQFMTLTRKLKMNRLGAYRVAGAPYVRALAPQAVDNIIDKLAETAVPVMVFVGNQGCIQIHSGPIQQVRRMGPWTNIMDPDFNLHLRADHVAEVYAVRKPTKRGMAISVEAFDKDGAIILQIFGMRTKEQDHVSAFEALVADLESAKDMVQA